MVGSTRYVDMELTKGAMMENFYWLEGPLSGDHGRRVLVLHNGQVAQCSNCLRKAGMGCPAGGNGKACVQMKTPRGKMNLYMESLYAKVGYPSLKAKYFQHQAKNFPALNGADSARNTNMEENEDYDEDFLTPMNPLDEKNKEIASLVKQLDEKSTTMDELNTAKEALKKSKAMLKITRKDLHTSQTKLTFTKNATEQKLIDCITNPVGYRDDPVLIGVYSATLNFEDLDLEEDGQETIARKEAFLKFMEDKI